MGDRKQRIGDYEVLGELGRGGMGIVYRARDTRDGRLAALKIVPPDSLEKKDSALRFKLEFRAMRRVRHPNVCRVFEAGEHNGAPFFTMEVVEGQDILQWLDNGQPIVPAPRGVPPNGLLTDEQRAKLNDPVRLQRAVDAISQVGWALNAIHAHRIVHRDLKPDNILVSKAGVVKLMDFGIAKQLTAASENSSGGMVVGTFKYLSPEQALGLDVDGRADLYCLGIVLYEILAGRHPFFSENSVGYAFHHARNPPPPISKFNPEAPPGLVKVCERLLAKDPNDRYPTADETIAAINEALGQSAPSPAAKPEPEEVSSPKRRERHTADALFNPGFIGRDRETRALKLVVSEVAQGQGRVVLVPAAKGMGKTRLLRELNTFSRPDRVRVVSARGQADGGEYHAWISVLDRIVGQLAQNRAEELPRLLGDDGPVLARYLPSAREIRDVVEAAALEPVAERQRFMSAVVSLLERVSTGTPYVVALDDLHLADELSLDLTYELAQRLLGPPDEGSFASISIVLAYAPDELSKAAKRLVDRLRRTDHCVDVTPAPLTADQIRELVQTMIGGGDVAPAIGDALQQASRGVPGECVRIVRAWAESGELRKQDGRWVLIKRGDDDSPFTSFSELPSFDSETGTSNLVDIGNATRADIEVPDLDADHVVRRRIRRLGELGRELGERMSIFGERIHGLTLTHLALMTEDELLDALEELIDAEIVQHEPDDGTYRFTRSELREALASDIPPERKRRLHRQVADLLAEEQRRSPSSANAELLARHFVEAGDLSRALEQLMRAARRALAAGATQTAAERVREAQELFLELSDAHPFDAQVARRDLDLILLRLDVLAAVGEHQQCVQLAERRLPKIRQRADRRLVGEVLLRLAQSERVLGRVDRALKHVAEVLQLTERGRLHRLRCRAKNLAGGIYELRGDHDRSGRYFGEALELARAIGDEREEEFARTALAQRMLHVGDLAAAERDFTELLDQAERRGEKLRAGAHVNALALIQHERGEYDEAEAGYRRMMKVAKPSGDRRAVAIGLCNVGVVRRDQGRLKEALNLCDKAARVLSAIDDAATLSYVHIVRGQTLIEAGDPRAAYKAADEALQLAERGGSALNAAEARQVRGLAKVLTGDPDGRNDIEVGLRAARRLQANRVVLYGLYALARAHLGEDRAEDALPVIDEGIGRARRTDFRRFVDRFEALAQSVDAV